MRQTTTRHNTLTAQLRNEWNLTNPATETRTRDDYVAQEMARIVGAFQADPADCVRTDRLAQITPDNEVCGCTNPYCQV